MSYAQKLRSCTPFGLKFESQLLFHRWMVLMEEETRILTSTTYTPEQVDEQLEWVEREIRRTRYKEKMVEVMRRKMCLDGNFREQPWLWLSRIPWFLRLALRKRRNHEK